jgi:hypothetical protein
MSSPPFHVFVGAGMWHPADACRVNHQAVLLSGLCGGRELFGSAGRAPEARSRRAKVLRPAANGLTVRDCAPGLPGDVGRGEARPVIEREVRQRFGLLSVGRRASMRPDVEARHPAPRGSICQDPDDWLESSTTNVAPSPGSDSTRSRPPILRVSSREMYSPRPVPPDKRVSCGPAR